MKTLRVALSLLCLAPVYEGRLGGGSWMFSSSSWEDDRNWRTLWKAFPSEHLPFFTLIDNLHPRLWQDWAVGVFSDLLPASTGTNSLYCEKTVNNSLGLRNVRKCQHPRGQCFENSVSQRSWKPSGYLKVYRWQRGWRKSKGRKFGQECHWPEGFVLESYKRKCSATGNLVNDGYLYGSMENQKMLRPILLSLLWSQQRCRR